MELERKKLKEDNFSLKITIFIHKNREKNDFLVEFV
jgi:hypothetical protein